MSGAGIAADLTMECAGFHVEMSESASPRVGE
jgi:hypothetical protein